MIFLAKGQGSGQDWKRKNGQKLDVTRSQRQNCFCVQIIMIKIELSTCYKFFGQNLLKTRIDRESGCYL